jgi:hypothetical protein
MKSLLIAAGVLALGITTASAEEWHFPYKREHHEHCQALGHRLHELERDLGHAEHEHRRHEIKEQIEHTAHELDHDCGGWRWRG